MWERLRSHGALTASPDVRGLASLPRLPCLDAVSRPPATPSGLCTTSSGPTLGLQVRAGWLSSSLLFARRPSLLPAPWNASSSVSCPRATPPLRSTPDCPAVVMAVAAEEGRNVGLLKEAQQQQQLAETLRVGGTGRGVSFDGFRGSCS